MAAVRNPANTLLFKESYKYHWARAWLRPLDGYSGKKGDLVAAHCYYSGNSHRNGSIVAFADPEIVDLHLLAGLANLTNRFTDPFGLELEMPEEKI